MNRVKKFYDLEGGENLVNANNYPLEIIDYLQDEKQVIIDNLRKRGYEGMLEIGCMEGRNLDVASKLGIKYIGIDIVKRFIESTNKKISVGGVNGFAKICDVKEIANLSQLLDSSFLGIFPFNSFGNVDSPKEALVSLSKKNLDILILTYKTTERAVSVREKYLNSCGLIDLVKVKDSKGVVFRSKEGLCSYAYFPKTIFQWAKTVGYEKIDSFNFSKIGKGYYLKK